MENRTYTENEEDRRDELIYLDVLDQTHRKSWVGEVIVKITTRKAGAAAQGSSW